MDKGIQLRAGAANFGRNMPNTSLAAFSGANSSSGVAGGAANSALTGTMSATAGMNNAYGARMNAIGSSTGLLTSALNNSARFAGADAAGWGGFAGGMLQRGLSGINARGGFGGMFGGSGGFVDQGGMGAASNAFLAEYGI
jgi:hypothetical protein